MEIVVAIKPVPDAETRLRVSADGTRLDPEGVKWVLAGYDESAVEQALLLKEAVPGSKVRAITFGVAPRSEEVLRGAIALGCDAATWVELDSGTTTDPISSACAVAHAVSRYPHELVLCGRQAGDDESGLFGPALGEALGIPSYGYAVNVRWAEGRHRLTLLRNLETGDESVEAALPCVIGLQQAWNDPRTAKLPNILKSRKAPIDKIPWSEIVGALGEKVRSRVERVRFELPPPRTGARLIDYKTPQEAAEKLVRVLREEAKVFP